MSFKSLLLVVGDQPTVDLLSWYLEREYFLIHHAGSGEEALAQAQRSPPDIAIIDDSIEDLSPADLCARLRLQSRETAFPVIVFSREDDDEARVRALNAGADDCIARPLRPRELIARLNAVIRRARPELAGTKLTFGDIEMDLAAHRVRRCGNPVQRGHVECRILCHFLENPGRVFARAQVVTLLWKGDADIKPRTTTPGRDANRSSRQSQKVSHLSADQPADAVPLPSRERPLVRDPVILVPAFMLNERQVPMRSFTGRNDSNVGGTRMTSAAFL